MFFETMYFQYRLFDECRTHRIRLDIIIKHFLFNEIHVMSDYVWTKGFREGGGINLPVEHVFCGLRSYFVN